MAYADRHALYREIRASLERLEAGKRRRTAAAGTPPPATAAIPDERLDRIGAQLDDIRDLLIRLEQRSQRPPLARQVAVAALVAAWALLFGALGMAVGWVAALQQAPAPRAPAGLSLDLPEAPAPRDRAAAGALPQPAALAPRGEPPAIAERWRARAAHAVGPPSRLAARAPAGTGPMETGLAIGESAAPVNPLSESSGPARRTVPLPALPRLIALDKPAAHAVSAIDGPVPELAAPAPVRPASVGALASAGMGSLLSARDPTAYDGALAPSAPAPDRIDAQERSALAAAPTARPAGPLARGSDDALPSTAETGLPAAAPHRAVSVALPAAPIGRPIVGLEAVPRQPEAHRVGGTLHPSRLAAMSPRSSQRPAARPQPRSPTVAARPATAAIVPVSASVDALADTPVATIRDGARLASFAHPLPPTQATLPRRDRAQAVTQPTPPVLLPRRSKKTVAPPQPQPVAVSPRSPAAVTRPAMARRPAAEEIKRPISVARTAPAKPAPPLPSSPLPSRNAMLPHSGATAAPPKPTPRAVAPVETDAVPEGEPPAAQREARLKPSLVLPDTTDVAGQPLRTASERLYFAWLGSMQTTAGARRLVQELRATYPDVLEGASWALKRVDLEEKGRWYRVLAGGADSASAAKATCRRVKEATPDAFCLPLGVGGER